MRLSYKLCAFLAALLILIGAAIPALALSLPVTFSLSDGQTLTLPGEFGADARFSSSNPAVVSVDDQGRVTGLKPGTASVVARENGETATTQVTVKKTAISLSTPVKQLYVGQSTQLAANFTPADSSLTVTWKSSNPQVLKINESGVALGLRPGASTVTATLSNGSSARVSLTVKRASVHLDQKSATIFEGKTLQLTASITPDDVGETVAFASTNKKVATVDEKGLVTAVGSGTATISATLKGGGRAICTVTVKKTALTLDKRSVVLYEGKTERLSATITPADGLYTAAAYTSSNKKVAEVNGEGLITAVGSGYATITAKLPNGVKASCSVQVRKNTVKLDKSRITVIEGKSEPLTATITPAGGKYTSATFTSSNKKVATVDENGTVTGLKSGMATIVAKLPNGSFASCYVTVKKATVKLDKTKATVYEGKTETLSATIIPADGLYTTVSYTSSHPKIAAVDEQGTVTGLKSGTAVITAKLASGTSTTCTVTVKKTAVTLNAAKLGIYEGKTAQLTATITPADGLYTSAAFSTSDAKVATVDEHGLVTGLKPGTATITAKLPSGSKATCTVTVKKATVMLDRTKASIHEGKSLILEATIVPADGLYTSAIFTSSDPRVASVDEHGVVKCLKPGAATITARLPSGTKATCVITVLRTTVSLDFPKLSLYQGEFGQLTASLNPADGLYSSASFSSSNPKVAAVDENGRVSALASGYATVTAKLPNGSKASCAVTVKAATIRFSANVGNAYLGAETELEYTVTPAEGAYSTPTWKSSDPTVVSVDAKGRVRGHKYGTATITGRLPNGVKASIRLTVKDPGVKVSQDHIVLYMDSAKKLTAKEWPSTGAQVSLTCSNSNPSVAEIAADGSLTPKKLGATTITFTHPNGSTASCLVEVHDYEVYQINVTPEDSSVEVNSTLQMHAEVLHALASNKSVTWSSSNTRVAVVNESGLVKGLRQGACLITATAKNGVKGQCQIYVAGTSYRALVITEFGLAEQSKYLAFANYSNSKVAAALKGRGYETSAYYNWMPKPQVLSLVEQFVAQADGNDVTCVYITTHGVNYQGKFYLVLPGWYESEGNMNYAISSAELMQALSGFKGHLLLVLSACNSGGFIQEQGSVLSSKNVTVLTSSRFGLSSGWYNSTGVKYDFMSCGFVRAFGYGITGGKLSTLPADADSDGALTAAEVARASQSYTASQAKAYFGTSNFVGGKEPQVPVILITHPDQVLYEP